MIKAIVGAKIDYARPKLTLNKTDQGQGSL